MAAKCSARRAIWTPSLAGETVGALTRTRFRGLGRAHRLLLAAAMSVTAAIFGLARHQHGIVSREQAMRAA